jgi:membrane fusion protein, heavy metal efflux system
MRNKQMNRRTLAIVAGIVILVAALLLMLWPESQVDTSVDDEAAETALPEGFVLIGEEQIRAAEIELATVQTGAAVELVFPATVAASPTASARIDARASGVVRSVGKTLGDYVRQGETIARLESAEAAALASQVSAARARVTELSSAYEREQRLYDANVTARQPFRRDGDDPVGPRTRPADRDRQRFPAESRA